jgi:hypothetical protein
VGCGFRSRSPQPRRRRCATPCSAASRAPPGCCPATFIRFFYGLPFAAAALAAIAAAGGALPAASLGFVAWVALGAVAQVVATAFFVAAMAQRSFVVAVVFSKTEVLQIGVYSVSSSASRCPPWR